MSLRRHLFPLCLPMAFLIAGCSIFNEYEQTLSISCYPSGVSLSVNGDFHPCPTKISMPRDRDVVIVAHKAGYLPETATVRSTLSGFGITDAISGGFLLVPLLGLLSPGAWELMKTDIQLSLQKVQ